MKGLCLALGVLAICVGAALYFNEHNDTSLFQEPDYTMAYVAVGVGAFLLLLGAVLSSSTANTLDRLETRPEAAGWHPDPLGRFDQRYWDGQRWTQHVGRVERDGSRRQLEDPV